MGEVKLLLHKKNNSGQWVPVEESDFSGSSISFGNVSNKPSTLAGYGITDASPSGHSHTFASLTLKPTTLSGFGITDGVSTSSANTFSTPQTFSAGIFGSGSNLTGLLSSQISDSTSIGIAANSGKLLKVGALGSLSIDILDVKNLSIQDGEFSFSITSSGSWLSSNRSVIAPDGDGFIALTQNADGSIGIPSVEELELTLALKAPLSSPQFTGIPIGPTAALGDSSNQLATTEFVMANSSAGAEYTFEIVDGDLILSY